MNVDQAQLISLVKITMSYHKSMSAPHYHIHVACAVFFFFLRATFENLNY